MYLATIWLALLECAVAFPHNDSPLWNIDWNKVRSEDIYVDPDTGINFFGPTGRIIGGSEMTRNGVPYQAAVINDRNGFCGGSLIKSNVVLTAAHCTISSASATVILGAHDITKVEDTQVRVTTSHIINHPSYNSTTFQYDIALLILPVNVPLSVNISLINLAPATAGDYAGSTALLTGWGRTVSTLSVRPPGLMGINFTVLANAECLKTFNFIAPNHMCTFGRGIAVSCYGDSGGPLVVNGVQVGIVTFSAKGCQTMYPTGYTRVSFYNQWIIDNS